MEARFNLIQAAGTSGFLQYAVSSLFKQISNIFFGTIGFTPLRLF